MPDNIFFKKKTNIELQGSIGRGFYSKSKIWCNSLPSQGEIFYHFVLILVYRHYFHILSPSGYLMSTFAQNCWNS